MAVVIAKCSCKNKQQDSMYGGGNRVHNTVKGAGKESPNKARCTVCGTINRV